MQLLVFKKGRITFNDENVSVAPLVTRCLRLSKQTYKTVLSEVKLTRVECQSLDLKGYIGCRDCGWYFVI